MFREYSLYDVELQAYDHTLLYNSVRISIFLAAAIF